MRHSHWVHKKIGELFDVQLGKMLCEKARKGSLSPYLANFNVRWGSFDLSNLNEMFFSDREKEKFSIKKGDLLMCEGGEIGRCAVWKKEESPFYYQKALHRLRPLDGKIISEFVYYYMQFIATKGELPKIVGETSIAHLTREKLLHLPIPVPPRAEQKQIIEKIQLWDSATEKTARLIAAKEKRFKWLVQAFINAPHSKWSVIHLRDISNDVVRKNSIDEKNVLTSSAQNGLISQLDFYSKNVSGENLAGYYLIRKGEFAYNRSAANGYPYGAIKRLDRYEQGVLSTLYLCFSIDAQKCNSDFMVHYFEAGLLNKGLRAVCQAGARSHGLLNIPKGDFYNLTINLPELSSQEKIAAILNAAKQEIHVLKKQAEALRKQKRGLMQKLLTGQWRVGARHAVPLQDAGPIGDAVPLQDDASLRSAPIEVDDQ